jgi:hypothetical protein
MRIRSSRTLATLVVFAAVCVAITVRAAEYNFQVQSGKKGCDSVITERGQDECARIQRAKDEACNVATECDVDRQERTIERYREVKDRLERGDVNDADKDRLRQTIRDLKEELDARKEGATRSIPIAKRCVAAREDVQKWFSDTGIPLTERSRDDALQIRRGLLEKLAEAQKKQAEAKAKREANPDDSSAQSEYDRATQEMRDAEKALEQFNDKYGHDIERHASRLIEHYRDERQSHERPLTESRNRVEKCERLERLSY